VSMLKQLSIRSTVEIPSVCKKRRLDVMLSPVTQTTAAVKKPLAHHLPNSNQRPHYWVRRQEPSHQRHRQCQSCQRESQISQIMFKQSTDYRIYSQNRFLMQAQPNSSPTRLRLGKPTLLSSGSLLSCQVPHSRVLSLK